MKKILLLLLLIFPGIFFAAELPVYRLALLLPVSGENQAIGKSIQEGISTFLKTIQTANGFEKFKIEVTVLDTESKPENAAKLIKYLDQKHAQFTAISGGITAEEVNALLDISEKHKLPYLFSFHVPFKNKLRQYYFPLIPSLYQGFKYAMRFFEEKKLPYKIIYDDTTKADAFILTDPTHLLDLNAPDFESQLSKTSILFLSNANVPKAMSLIKDKSLKVFNYHQQGLVYQTTDPAAWNGTLFLNWVKNSKAETVQYFRETFESLYKTRPNNYHMLGWILSDLFYESLLRLTNLGYSVITRDQIVDFLERTSWKGGYDEGCGYKVFYAPFSFAADEARAGISGMYFMEIQEGKLVIISDFAPLYLNLEKYLKSDADVDALESEEKQKNAKLNEVTEKKDEESSKKVEINSEKKPETIPGEIPETEDKKPVVDNTETKELTDDELDSDD